MFQLMTDVRVISVNENRKQGSSCFGYIFGITGFSADSSNDQLNDQEGNFFHISPVCNVFTCNFLNNGTFEGRS